MRHFEGMATEMQDERDGPVPEERRRLILELLRERRSITIGAVEQQFGVSPMTARLDLAVLVREGHARRTHGGAVLPDLAAHEDSFRHRLELEVSEKERLAGHRLDARAERDTLSSTPRRPGSTRRRGLSRPAST
jgi:DeoR/GlpR family transcriptional regulator of sugar metabolism